jgi:hypothetical protein
MKNLGHSASFDSELKGAPSKLGIKHLTQTMSTYQLTAHEEEVPYAGVGGETDRPLICKFGLGPAVRLLQQMRASRPIRLVAVELRPSGQLVEKLQSDFGAANIRNGGGQVYGDNRRTGKFVKPVVKVDDRLPVGCPRKPDASHNDLIAEPSAGLRHQRFGGEERRQRRQQVRVEEHTPGSRWVTGSRRPRDSAGSGETSGLVPSIKTTEAW